MAGHLFIVYDVPMTVRTTLQLGDPGARQRLVHLAFYRPTVLVNPVIVARSEGTWEPRVRRAVWVEVEYQSLDGRRCRLRADGELGELLQHEIDHLDGVLAVDRMTSVDTLCVRSEFERRHRDESPYRP
jgi:peptide deformylase